MAFLWKHTSGKQILFAACLTGFTCATAFANEGGLHLPKHSGETLELQLTAAPESPVSELLQVFVGKPEACCENKSPIAGRYRLDGERVIFDPAFDFVKGQSYTVLSRSGLTGTTSAEHLTEFKIEADTSFVSPEVIAIYPSGAEIPENTLRFYIHFSTPMRPHMATNFISLVDENGRSDNAAFMTFKQELWNANRTRLTLLMDPGRIKREVAQNRTLGPALREGHAYSIAIKEGWPSAAGDQRAPEFKKVFKISGALRTLPNTGLWQFRKPRRNTSDPLSIRFDRPFDGQLAQSAITVLDDQGARIAGSVSLRNDEKSWHFHPRTAWKTNAIQVVVDARLEDVAGNNFRDLLDHSITTDIEAIDSHVITLELQPATK